MSGTLVVCSSPIGNLGDASPRLAEALAGADVVYAEDTRRTRKLLLHFGIERPLRSYFVGNEEQRSTELAERLAAGETVALITDAGTPAISDPGLTAVRAAVSVSATVTAVPGPSAVTAALAVAGLPSERFVFESFLPRKQSARMATLEALRDEERTIVVFSATSRVGTDLEDLAAHLGPGRSLVVCRELTKAHEQVWRGTLDAASALWSTGTEARGEFTLVIEGARPVTANPESLLGEVSVVVDAGASLSEAVRAVAATSGVSRRTLYEAALKARDGA